MKYIRRKRLVAKYSWRMIMMMINDYDSDDDDHSDDDHHSDVDDEMMMRCHVGSQVVSR